MRTLAGYRPKTTEISESRFKYRKQATSLSWSNRPGPDVFSPYFKHHSWILRYGVAAESPRASPQAWCKIVEIWSGRSAWLPQTTVNPRTKNLDFRGFDSSRFLISRGVVRLIGATCSRPRPALCVSGAANILWYYSIYIYIYMYEYVHIVMLYDIIWYDIL